MLLKSMKNGSHDVLIVGGGIMGCSLAFSLLSMEPDLKVAVIERDPTYEQASTTLSAANIRVQFSLEKNIRISQYGLRVLDRFEEEMAVGEERPSISFRREGNLFLVNERGRKEAEKALALQKRLGCRVEWWSPEKIRHELPLYEPKKMAGGTFGAQDGHFDAYSFLMGYKRKAKSMGAQFLTDEAVKVECKGNSVAGVRLRSNTVLRARIVANCAGAWAASVALSAGVKIPVQPIRRQVYVLDPAFKSGDPLPLTVLPSGLYFRTETGGVILLGKSMPDDPIGVDFTWDHERFTEILWPELASFVPRFDTLKLLRGWAGLYAVNTLDQNAILGEWPELRGFYLANGFSGHGLQQAPAVGRYLAELILGKEPSLDLSIFGPERILEKRPLNEDGIV